MIFEPFTQADTSTTREYGGTGLGLAISSQLIGLMGGEVEISSEVGIGSIFSFTIRVQTLAGESMPGLEPLDAELAGVRALIVDENVTQRSILSDYLGRWGMSVETAVSTIAALEALRTAAAEDRPIAVTLVDTSMRRLQGVSLESAIRADPSLTTHLVLMTEERDFEDIAELGDGVCLSKPIHRDELRTCLRDALDLVTPADAADALDGSSSTEGKESGRLLLAEDNVINQMVAVAILSKAGYEVDTVRNGAQAVRAAASQKYDAILMDCQMPQMNGYEATKAIRHEEGTGQHIPIIALTAGARGEDRAHCLEVGMDEYLAKPLHRTPLLQMVKQWVMSGQETGAVLPLPAKGTTSPAA